MELCPQNKCLGCCACANACPRGAITMAEDAHGVLLPRIDGSKCVECGMCARACPVLTPVQLHPEGTCLAAWSTDGELRRTVASAGIVSELSRSVLRRGGVVFGTRYEDRRLIFDCIERESDIPRFQGSKYVHAYIGDAYSRVRSFLNEGRPVLFPGTPCQIAGLRAYLRRDYDELLTVDLLCHGVATNRYLNDYLAHRGIEGYDSVLFRGAHGQKLVVLRDGKAVRIEEKPLSPFYMAYVRGLMHRENCYSCPFASTGRCGDLTAGDFWGLERSRLRADLRGIPFPSLVLVNTEKGRAALANARIASEERPISEAIPGNGQLSRPCVRHPDRDVFLSCYQNGNYHAALKKSGFLREYRKQALPYRIRLCLSRVKRAIIK